MECDIPCESQLNLETGDANGDPEDVPGHSFLNVAL
jgi:hypothetical protein